MNGSLDSTLVARLIAEARSGSSESRERLISISYPFVEQWNRSWSEMCVRKSLSTRDLTQEIMSIASYSFPAFQGGTAASWLAWLRQIQSRHVFSIMNKKDPIPVGAETYQGAGVTLDLNDLKSRDATPGTLAAINDDKDRVRFVLSRMSPEKRRSLQLLIADYSISEIAEIMGKADHQVRYLHKIAFEEFSNLWKNLRDND